MVKRYGAPDEEELKVVDMSVKGNMVELVIECQSNPDFKPLKKKIPKTQTVQKFRALLVRLVKRQKNAEIQISVRSIDDPKIEVQMDNDLRNLSFYSLVDGDTILVKWD